GFGGEIIGYPAQILQAEILYERRHDRISALAAVVVVQFLVEEIALLPPNGRRIAAHRLAALTMAGAANCRLRRHVVLGIGRHRDECRNDHSAKCGCDETLDHVSTPL